MGSQAHRQTVPLRGTASEIRYLFTRLSTHELPIMYAVCPLPSQPSNTPDFRSPARAWAQRYGVAGSRSFPMTRIGGAPAARIDGSAIGMQLGL